MFINKETGKPAFLREHGNDVTYSTKAEGGTVKTVPSHEFFTDHREATREEIDEAAPPPAPNAGDVLAEAKRLLSETKAAAGEAKSHAKDAEKSATEAAKQSTAAAGAAEKAGKAVAPAK